MNVSAIALSRLWSSRLGSLDLRLVACLCGIGILPIILYLPFLDEPFQRDEGFYAAVGQLILHGQLPYRDAFDNKPPVVFGWYALAFLMFGTKVWAPRLLVSVLLSLTALLVFLEGRLLWSVRAGIVAGFAFGASVGLARFDTNANTEFFLVLPMVAGLVAFTIASQRQSGAWFLVAGICNGLAIMTKETALFPFGFLVVWAGAKAFSPGKSGGGGRAVLLLPVGCGISIGALILPFLLAGAWSDFWDSAVVYTLSYVGDTSVLTRLAVFIATGIFPYAVAGPWIVLSVLATIHTLRTPTDSRNWLLIGWLAASGASIIFVGRLYSHYYVQLLPGMSLLVPVGLVALRRRMVSRPKVAIAYGLVIATLVSLVCILSAQVYLRESASNRHEAKFPRDPETQLEVQSPDLGRYIRERTDPSDYVYNLGFQSELYFYSDRRSPTRYMFDRLFEVDKTLMAKALTDLNQNKPKLVIDSARYETWREIRYDRTPIDDFLRINYEHLGKAYYADIYRLRPSSQ